MQSVEERLSTLTPQERGALDAVGATWEAALEVALEVIPLSIQVDTLVSGTVCYALDPAELYVLITAGPAGAPAPDPSLAVFVVPITPAAGQRLDALVAAGFDPLWWANARHWQRLATQSVLVTAAAAWEMAQLIPAWGDANPCGN